MKKKQKLFSLLSVLVISSVLAMGCQSQTDPTKKKSDTQVEQVGSGLAEPKLETDDAKEYLETIFDISFADEQSKEAIQKAGKELFGKDSPEMDGELTGLSLIKYATQLGDYDELALSYGEEKVKASLKAAGLDTELDSKFAAYVATAVDTKMLDVEIVKELLEASELSEDQLAKVMMATVDVRGKGRNYLGYSNDPNIYRKLEDSFNSFVLFKDKELGDFGAKAVADEVVTGYNMKLNSYNANFLPETSITYGHSDIRHAHQLVGLLNSEDIVVKVQLEPKVSIFQYLLEWGPIPEPLPTYFVEKVGDLHLVNAVEYDLALEFKDTKEMEKFDQVIEDYAKKSDENEDGEGMIAASWWQPFLKIDNKGLTKDRFYQVYDSSISNDMYSMHSIVLPEDKERVEKRFNEIGGETEINIAEKYCNLAFYNYLKGEDYQ